MPYTKTHRSDDGARRLFHWLSLLSHRQLIAGMLLIGVWFAGSNVWGHAVGETYVWLNVEEQNITGRVEISLRDLREKLDISIPESDGDQQAALEQTRDQVLAYINQHLALEANGQPIPLNFKKVTFLDLGEAEGQYAQYQYDTPTGDVPDKITIQNSLFVDSSTIHRSLLCIERNRKSGQEFGGEFTALIFGPHNPVQELDLRHIELLLRPRDFVWQGVLHIWIGIDHILFIVALLLPAVLGFEKVSLPDGSDNELSESTGKDARSRWVPLESFRAALWRVVHIVTIFTIAHSITLSLAALGLVDLSSRLVESVIALSIVWVAWNTVTQKFQDKTWLVIFGFGLFHGMGFASVMSDLPFRMVHLVKVLIGFNVGVELGQLAIVACVFPVLFLLRKASFYAPIILNGGSIVIGLIATYWFIERAFGL